MLNDRTADLASLLDRDELYQDFLRIASFVRRSDGEGEEASALVLRQSSKICWPDS